eukprot:4053815-Pleurochrysis_carterae.AAC.1
MELRAILDVVLEVVAYATRSGTCSCILWGHPVATLPSDGGDYTSLSLNDVNAANQKLKPEQLDGAASRVSDE